MSRDKKMDIALAVMYVAIYTALIVAFSMLRGFREMIDLLCVSALELAVFSRVAYKIMYWVCGKLDKWGI